MDRAALYDALCREAPRRARRSTCSIRSRPIPPIRCSQLPNVVATPHLGASTVEAQERVSIQTVEALLEALAGAAYVPAVNLPFRGPEGRGRRGGLDAAGRAHGALPVGAAPAAASRGSAVETWGLPEDMLRPVAVAAVKGALETHTPETVNYVNALYVAQDRGLARQRDAPRGAGQLRALAARDALGRRSTAHGATRRSSPGATRASSRSTACRSSSGRRARSSSCATATCPASSAASARSSARPASTSPTSRSRAAPGSQRRRRHRRRLGAAAGASLERLRAVPGRRRGPGGELVSAHARRRSLRRAVGRARGVADLGADDRAARSTPRATR